MDVETHYGLRPRGKLRAPRAQDIFYDDDDEQLDEEGYLITEEKEGGGSKRRSGKDDVEQLATPQKKSRGRGRRRKGHEEEEEEEEQELLEVLAVVPAAAAAAELPAASVEKRRGKGQPYAEMLDHDVLGIVADKLAVSDRFTGVDDWCEMAANLTMVCKASRFAQGLAGHLWRRVREAKKVPSSAEDLMDYDLAELRWLARLRGLDGSRKKARIT